MDRDFDVDEFLSKPQMAHLATSSLDGPRDSPVWFLWEEQAIWLIGSFRDSYPRRLREDPRCALGVVEFDLSKGILRHDGIRGTAEVRPLDQARLHRLLDRYLGEDETQWDEGFRSEVIERLDLMIRIEPLSIVARDQSYFKRGQTLRRGPEILSLEN